MQISPPHNTLSEKKRAKPNPMNKIPHRLCVGRYLFTLNEQAASPYRVRREERSKTRLSGQERTSVKVL